MKKYLFKHKLLLAVNVILTITEAILSVGLAFILSGIIDAAVSQDLDSLKVHLFVSIAYIFSQIILGIGSNYLNGLYTSKVEMAYRNDVFESIIGQRPVDFFKKKEGEYISILTNDIDDVLDSYLYSFLSIVSTLAMIILTIVSIISIDYRILIVVITVGILYSLISKKIGAGLSDYKDICYKAMSGFVVNIKGLVGGYEIINKANLWDYAQDSYKESNKEFLNQKMKLGIHFANINLVNQLLGQGLVIIVISIVSYLVFLDNLSVGDLIAIAQLMTGLIVPIGNINEIINQRASSINLLNKQEELIENLSKSKTEFDDNLCQIADFKDEIVMEDISFAIGEVDILKNISLSLKKGEKYAIIGESGSGKSTLLKLLQNYYNNYQGFISIDGIDYKNLKDNSLSNLISTTDQNIYLFDGTIKDNIALFKNIDDKKLDKILRITALDKVLKRKNCSIHTKVFENGLNLSGGEKQRIALARMLARQTDIMILDEATSSIDRETAGFILKNILEQEDKTIIAITHHLEEENKNLYDKIIRIKNGSVEYIVDNNSKATDYSLAKLQAV